MDGLDGGGRGNSPAGPKSRELIRRNVPATWRFYKISRVSERSIWQLTNPRESICERKIAQHITRWSPFYLTIIREPNETLFRTREVGGRGGGVISN